MQKKKKSTRVTGGIRMDIQVKGGYLQREEIDEYVEFAVNKYPERTIKKLTITLDGEFVDVYSEFEDVPFQRVRRITGYLVGDLSRFNNAKRHEVEERVKHGCRCRYRIKSKW